jgi:hypothetical protein
MGELIRKRLPDPITYFESEGLKLQGKGTWRTTECKFHGGSDSMRVNTQTGAWVCMAGCGARGGDVLAHHMAEHGLDFATAAKAMKVWKDDGKPNKHQRPKPVPPTAAIQVLALESNVVAIAAGNIAEGVILTDADRARVLVAAQRISHVTEKYK